VSSSPATRGEAYATRDGAIVEITLNRPDRLNAVSLALYEGLIAELSSAEQDAEVRCVILTGAGRAFCAGADLKAHADAGPPTPETRARYISAAQEANHLIQTMGTPVVAAVNGHAIGAGLELALSSDFMLVAEEAKLRLPEIALGTFVGGGVVYTLAERVGTLKAREILYFGDFFSGRQAAEMGVANLAVPATDLLSIAREWAGRLSAQAPLSLAAAKRLVGPAGSLTKDQALEREREVLDQIFGSEDWAEGLAAFHEGRPPRYKGQ
jgi:enoyl-CoA hydratase